MKAVAYDRPGGPEVLEYRDVPDPVPMAGDVVVAVEACALNRLDVVQRNGWFQLPGFTYPHIAGLDVAGRVVAVGEAVTRVAVGDRVVIDPSLAGVADTSADAGLGDRDVEPVIIGGTIPGGYAERCLAPASHVHRVPDAMPIERAATFPTCWLTAWHALFDVGGLQAGETMLVHAAGSGVSTAAILLAKWTGATVLATAGSDRTCARARAIGADAVCNNRTEDVSAFARAATGGAGVDLVLDHVGPALWAASLSSLKPRGRLVTCGNTTGDTVTVPSLGQLFHLGIRILGSDAYRPEEFALAWDVFCRTDFPSLVHAEFPLAEAAAAQECLLAGGVFGKILLRP